MKRLRSGVPAGALGSWPMGEVDDACLWCGPLLMDQRAGFIVALGRAVFA